MALARAASGRALCRAASSSSGGRRVVGERRALAVCQRTHAVEMPAGPQRQCQAPRESRADWPLGAAIRWSNLPLLCDT